MSITAEARKEQNERKMRAQKALRKLQACGYSPHDISDALEERISWRTLYRWLNAEKNPKRRSDVVALEKLVLRLCK